VKKQRSRRIKRMMKIKGGGVVRDGYVVVG